MKENISRLFICQAPHDLHYIINELSINQTKNDSICVIGLSNIYKYLKSLNFQNNLIFIPNISSRNILRTITSILKIKSFVRKYSVSNCYFTSKVHDLATLYLINNLKLQGSLICQLKIYNIKITYIEQNYIHKLISRIVYVFLNLKIKFINSTNMTLYMGEIDCLFKNLESRKINKNLLFNPRIINHHKFKILFLESNGQSYFKNYEKTLIKIINVLKSYDIEIWVKGHPRLGISEILKSNYFNKIENYIPSEFVNTKDFDLIVGIESTSMCKLFKNTNVISLLELFTFHDGAVKKELKEYLVYNTENSIHFIDDFKQLNEYFQNRI